MPNAGLVEGDDIKKCYSHVHEKVVWQTALCGICC